MKRDDDFLRNWLLKHQEEDEWLLVMPGETLDADEEEQKERYHVMLLIDAGFVTSVGRSTIRITAQGQDYIEAIRDNGIWEQTKKVVAETGGSASLEIVKSLGMGFLKKKISQHTGIEL